MDSEQLVAMPVQEPFALHYCSLKQVAVVAQLVAKLATAAITVVIITEQQAELCTRKGCHSQQ